MPTKLTREEFLKLSTAEQFAYFEAMTGAKVLLGVATPEQQREFNEQARAAQSRQYTAEASLRQQTDQYVDERIGRRLEKK